MNARGLLARMVAPLVRATEGAFRPGPYPLPITGGWLPDGAPLNFWQCGIDPAGGFSRSSMVEACVSAYAQTVAMCAGAGGHWRLNGKGGRDRVTNSALARILRRPNLYQSSSDFLLNATRNLFLEGNAYALALRNDRYEIDELHLMDSRMSRPTVAQTGDIFYHLGGNEVISQQLGSQEQIIVPQRDVLHIRLHTDRRHPRPLVGETPLAAAVADIGVGDAIAQQQTQFYMNQARPSAVLSTDQNFDKDQVQFLRDRWDEQTRGLNQGKTPILTGGLKVIPWSTPGKDAAIAEVMKISQDRIALVFRVPLPVLGLGGPTFGSTESLMQFWIATGLGFALNHIESAFDLLFQLKGQPEEFTEFSTDALLRSAMKDRIEALARGVQGGIYSPNEARNSEGLPDASHGDEPRVQAQVVPLSAAQGIPSAPTSPAAPAGDAAPTSDAKPEPPPKKDYRDDVQREARRVIAAAARYGRPPA
jgi:HK97 family phage portal protein